MNLKGNENRGKGNGGSVFKTENGDYIPVPDKNRTTKFKGKDIGAGGKKTYTIKKFDNENDFSVDFEDYADKAFISGNIEEFYYTDKCSFHSLS